MNEKRLTVEDALQAPVYLVYTPWVKYVKVKKGLLPLFAELGWDLEDLTQEGFILVLSWLQRERDRNPGRLINSLFLCELGRWRLLSSLQWRTRRGTETRSGFIAVNGAVSLSDPDNSIDPEDAADNPLTFEDEPAERILDAVNTPPDYIPAIVSYFKGRYTIPEAAGRWSLDPVLLTKEIRAARNKIRNRYTFEEVKGLL